MDFGPKKLHFRPQILRSFVLHLWCPHFFYSEGPDAFLARNLFFVATLKKIVTIMTAHLKRQPFCVDCIAGRSPGGHPAPFGAQNWPKNLIFLRLTFITHTFKNEYQYNSKTTECTKCRRHFNIKDIYFFMWELCFVREFHVRFIPIWRSVCDANREFYTAGKVIIRSPAMCHQWPFF